VEAKLKRLEEELAITIGKKEALIRQAYDCEQKLIRAGKLIGGLGGERIRWIANIASIGVDLGLLIGDVTIAAGHIAYTGPFTPPYRAALNNEWLQKLTDLKVN
jgi:dynein heavy chain